MKYLAAGFVAGFIGVAWILVSNYLGDRRLLQHLDKTEAYSRERELRHGTTDDRRKGSC